MLTVAEIPLQPGELNFPDINRAEQGLEQIDSPKCIAQDCGIWRVLPGFPIRLRDRINYHRQFRAATGAGVARSHNGGTDWRQANSGLPSLAVRALAAAPDAEDTLLAGLITGCDASVVAEVCVAGHWHTCNDMQ